MGTTKKKITRKKTPTKVKTSKIAGTPITQRLKAASTTTLLSITETPTVIDGSVKSWLSTFTNTDNLPLFVVLAGLVFVVLAMILCCFCSRSKKDEGIERLEEEELPASERAARHRQASPPKKHEHHEHRESHERRERHERHEPHSEKASAKETRSKGSSTSKASSASRGSSKPPSPRKSKTPTAPKHDEFARPRSEKETQTSTGFDTTAQTMDTMDLQMGRPPRRIDRATKRLKRLLRLTSREERKSGMAPQQDQARTNILDEMGNVEEASQTPSVTASGAAPPGYEQAVPFMPTTQTSEERKW
ncbi:unnamed protein product [Cylicocyclus nassatus]|uniref:Uncharacterized protein n=1 Tax=Cylicocyclus nassatus TaxID=53992 RepID=A0AA36GWN0_CYLNA|nr:unnamed protein product [Cylicocyclus nassatus]